MTAEKTLSDYPEDLVNQVRSEHMFRYNNYRDMMMLALKGEYFSASEESKAKYSRQADDYEMKAEIYQLLHPEA